MTQKTLRTLQALADSGLIAPARLPALERVAAQYAVAITPALAALIDPADFTEAGPEHTGPAVLAVAAKVGTTRLIDNLPLDFGAAE